MLILSRRIDETVHIGDDIEVTVLSINGGQVRLGIKAPRTVAVDREEIANRKQREHADSLLGATPATAIAPEPAAGSGRSPVRITQRRIHTPAVQSSLLPPTPEHGHPSTLRIAPPKSKITGA
jgi:carbon storage regulator